jgi:NAD(P)H-flavin reductase
LNILIVLWKEVIYYFFEKYYIIKKYYILNYYLRSIMMKIADFKGIFSKAYLEVESVENPFKDFYLIKLKLPNGYTWSAGEHVNISFPDRKYMGRKWKTFSIASIDKEGYMLIATRTGEEASRYKSHLIDLRPGERVGVRGPFGSFKIADTSSPSVLVASGVGITPMRALIKAMAEDSNREINLVFAASDYYLFADEIEAMTVENSNIKLFKTSNRADTLEKVADLAAEYGNKAYYYMSGSNSMINSTEDVLNNKEISKKRIVKDPFIGY